MDSKRGKSLALAFDSSPGGESSSIAVASVRDDGLYHVAVLDHREGTGWLAKEVHRIYVAHHPNVVMCDPRSPAANALPELTSLGVQVEELSGTDQAAAFSMFVAACDDDKLRHGNQPELNDALIGGVRRKLNDAYAWSRSSSAVDISPIVAVSEALFAVQTIDTEVHIYSLNEIVAERRAAAAAQQQDDFIRLPDADTAAASPDGIYYLPSGVKVTPLSAMTPRRSALSHIPDQQQSPVDAPAIGTPTQVPAESS